VTQDHRDPRDDVPGGLAISEPVVALGLVLDQDRGSLPFALVHGEPLVACAAWALGEAGVTLVDAGTPWSSLVAAGDPLVLHDPLCPLTPPGFIAECLAAAEGGAVVVGVRPVTDTVKVVIDGYVGATVNRDALVQVASPVVLPAAVVAEFDELPSSDLTALVAAMAPHLAVVTREAPPSARRVGGTDDLRLLEALS
jgi:2-C-methyl-D-erythritol 4-phosphate cytidylyltransferase